MLQREINSLASASKLSSSHTFLCTIIATCFSLSCVMLDRKYVFILRRAENERSAVHVVTGIVIAKQNSLASSVKSS
jgi:hypothetical protein